MTISSRLDNYKLLLQALPDIAPEEFKDSRKLADEIMTLPWDQRHGRHNIKRITEIMLKELKL